MNAERGISGAKYYLVRRGDDEVCVVHGDEVGGELRREVVLVVERLPVDVAVRVLGLLQRVRNVALRHLGTNMTGSVRVMQQIHRHGKKRQGYATDSSSPQEASGNTTLTSRH